MTELRMRFLMEFDNYIRFTIGDEFITYYWQMNGVPDEADADDYFEIADSDELWVDCVKAFDKCYEKAVKMGVVTL